MQCISPITFKNPAKAAGSYIQTVVCGKCGACRHNRRVEWSFRIGEEAKQHIYLHFITLTYSDETIPYSDKGKPTLVKKHLQDWFKRVRKQQSKITEDKIRYYAVGEYGTRTERPHYHVIMFGLYPEIAKELQGTWMKGFIKVGTVTPKSIHYTTKYHVNYKKNREGQEDEFALMSRKPGIGAFYLDRTHEMTQKQVEIIKKEFDENGMLSNWKRKKKKVLSAYTGWNVSNNYMYVMNNGYKQKMPRYYKERIFSKARIKRLSEARMSEQDKELREKAIALLEKGYENPFREMEKRDIERSNQVLDKGEKNNIF